MSLNNTTNDIPYGYCHCGCGQLAPIAKESSTKYGWRKGEPVRYIRGHSGRKPDNLGLVALCQCGCGQPAPIAKKTSRERGYTKGEPVRFIPGHYARTRDYQPLKRFWGRVKKQPDGCWLWQAHLNPGGYGVFNGDGKIWLAHRYSYQLHNGSIPDNFFVCHHCDNPACVRPDHLFLGTHQDNMDDMTAKGRPRGRYAKRDK